MEQFKIAKILMLATNNKSNIVLGKRNTLYNTKDIPNVEFNNVLSPNNWIYQYLYFLSDKKIKEDDWCIDSNGNIFQYKNHFPISIGQRKIIATTNNSLTEDRQKAAFVVTGHPLPQPSEQFIQKYIEEYNKGNIITDVLVEYNYFLDDNGVLPYWNLKVNPKDNTITIKKTKEIYTKDEVIKLLERYTSFVWSEVGIHYPISLGKDAKDKFINSEL